MKWMIASDLHGSAFYCKKMIKAFERERADRLLLLGDLLYHGPRNDLPEGYAAASKSPKYFRQRFLCLSRSPRRARLPPGQQGPECQNSSSFPAADSCAACLPVILCCLFYC